MRTMKSEVAVAWEPFLEELCRHSTLLCEDTANCVILFMMQCAAISRLIYLDIVYSQRFHC